MVWIVVLLACSRGFCDTRPEDLAVEDPDGIASEEGLAAAQGGLDDFREWTARDAICVSELRFVEELWVPPGFAEGFDASGKYTSLDGLVRMEDHGDYNRTISRHELCHGLDWTEDLSEPNAEIFDLERYAAVSAYPEGARVRETFARACAEGPSYGVAETLAEECGIAVEVDAVAEFLHQEVFRGHDDDAKIVAGGLQVAWTPMPELPPEAYVSDVVATWGGLAGSTIASEGVTHDKLWILGTEGTFVVEADAGPDVEYLYPVAWNHGAAYLADLTMTWPRVLGTDGSVREAPGLGDSAQVVWDDVVFARSEDGIVARDLWTGEPVDLGIDSAWWSEYGASTWARPAGDAVLVWSPGGDGWVGTPESGWTWTDVPDHEGFAIGDVAIRFESVQPADDEAANVLFVVGLGPDGEVYTTDDACAGFRGRLMSVDDAPWVVDAYAARFGRVVLAR